MISPTHARRRRFGTIAAVTVLAVTGCGSDQQAAPTPAPLTTVDASADNPNTGDPSTSVSPDATASATAADTSGSSGAAATLSGEVTLITHDSFAVDPALLANFEAESGLTVNVLAQGDSGAMLSQLILTKENPLGDVVFGIDNTFAGRALDADILAPGATPGPGAAEYRIDDTDRLAAVDFGDVCVNVDHRWFAENGIAEPTGFEDLALPQYRDLFVTPSPATSSPGLAFLLGTIGHFGEDGWQQYWTALKDNGVKITGGWSDAYAVDFSGSSGKGDRPLVLSYASSPPYEVTDPTAPAPTGALLDTCFRQVEYAGVLNGAKNPAGAAAVVDFLLSPEFQEQIPEQMYVYPVDEQVALPTDWAKYAATADNPVEVDPALITTNREAWIEEWSDLLES